MYSIRDKIQEIIVRDESLEIHVRAAIIAQIENQDLLIELAYYGEDDLIRLDAFRMIEDEEILKDIYLNEERGYIKEAELKNIHDNDFLYSQFKNADHPTDKASLIMQIDDEDILVDIVLNDWTEGYRHIQYRNRPVQRFPNPYFTKMKAIEKIKLESNFIKIAKEIDTKHGRGFDSGDISEISAYAVSHIGDDQEVLKDIAFNAKFHTSRAKATERITDENVLFDIAKNDSSVMVTQKAMLCIDDENLLRETIFQCPHTSHAIERIENQSILLDIAKGDCKDFYRSDACRKISGENDLKDIFLNDLSIDVRRQAISNWHLKDEAFLADVAFNDPDPYVRQSAVSNYNLSDENILKEIALSDSEGIVCRAAVEKIENMDILEDIIYRIDDKYALRTILGKENFANQKILEEFAQPDQEKDVREVCVRKITNRKILEEIALNDESEYVRSEAVGNPNFTDQNLLKSIALNDESEAVRRESLRNITDNDFLCEIFYNGDECLRSSACGGISDENVLKDIVKNEDDEYIQRLACWRIEDVKFLKWVVKYYGGYLAMDVCSRITDGDFLAEILMKSNDGNQRYRACTNPNLKDKDAFLYALQNDSNKAIRKVSSRNLKILAGAKLKVMFADNTNTLLSAMAEGIFEKMCGDKAEVYSSGIVVKTGDKPSKMAVDVCKSHGIDIADHEAIHFKDTNIEDMDCVLTFNEVQNDKISIYYPQLEVRTISVFCRCREISGPKGGDLKAYDECFDELCNTLKKLMKHLRIEP